MGDFGNPPDPSRPQQFFPGITARRFNPVEASRAYADCIHKEKDLRSTHQHLDSEGRLAVKWPHDRARAAKDDLEAAIQSKMACLGDLIPGYESISTAYKQLGWETTDWGQVSGPELPAARASASRAGRSSAGRTATSQTVSSKQSRRSHLDPSQLRHHVASAVEAALGKPAQEEEAQPPREPCQEQLTALSMLEHQRRIRSVATPSTRKTVRAWGELHRAAMEQPAFGAQDPEIQDVTAKQTHMKGGVLRPASRSTSLSTASTAASDGGGSRNFCRTTSAKGQRPPSCGRAQSAGRQQRPSSQKKLPPSMLEKLLRPHSAQVPGRGQHQHSASAPNLLQESQSNSHSQNQLSQSLIRERCGRDGSKPLFC